MKQILTLLLTVTILGLNAQIFYNSTGKPTLKTTTTEEKTEKQIEITTDELEEKITTPSTKTITTPTYSTKTTTNYNSSVAKNNSDVPPNAEPGKCYARCVIPDKYDWVNKKVVDQPRMVKKVKVPALYATVYDTVVVKPRSVKKINIPAEYEYIEEKIMVAPATTKWVKGKADAGCLSADPEDCQVMCLVEVPAQYRTTRKKVLKHDAYTSESVTPEEIKIVTREVKVKDESYMDIVIPETYKMVQERVVVSKGGYQEWREVLCGDKMTTERIIKIQQALKAKGYNPGPIDDVFGPLTKAALIKYQKDNGLPVGNLNIETLNHLGVK